MTLRMRIGAFSSVMSMTKVMSADVGVEELAYTGTLGKNPTVGCARRFVHDGSEWICDAEEKGGGELSALGPTAPGVQRKSEKLRDLGQ